MSPRGVWQFVVHAALLVSSHVVAVHDASTLHATTHAIPKAWGADRHCRGTIDYVHVLTGIAHDTTNFVKTYECSEAGTVDDVTISCVAHDATHTSHALQDVVLVEDEIGNDSVRLDASSGHSHKAHTVGALIGIEDASDVMPVAVDDPPEGIVGVA